MHADICNIIIIKKINWLYKAIRNNTFKDSMMC